MSALAEQDPAEARTRRLGLAGLSLAMLLSSLGISTVNVALPTLAQAFDASFQQVQSIVLAYLLAVTILIVGAGRLGDIIGHRRLLFIGIVVFTLASLLCGVAATLPWLIAARATQGAGAAILMALTLALVGETVPNERTGSAMGLIGTMSAIGTALGPSLGGLLIAGLGWRAIFLVNVPLGVLALLLAHRALPADRPRAKTDRPGLGIMGSALLRDRALGASLAMSVLVSTVMMATLVVGPFYLSGALGLEAARVGLVVSAGPIVTALTGLPAGRVADRFGARRMIIIGLTGIAAGAVILSMLPTTFGIAGYVAPLVVMTAGYALFQTANNTAVMTNVREDQRGVVSGMLNLSRNLGLFTGASGLGAVFACASAATGIAAGMRITFAAAALLIAGALGIAVASRVLARK